MFSSDVLGTQITSQLLTRRVLIIIQYIGFTDKDGKMMRTSEDTYFLSFRTT